MAPQITIGAKTLLLPLWFYTFFGIVPAILVAIGMIVFISYVVLMKQKCCSINRLAGCCASFTMILDTCLCFCDWCKKEIYSDVNRTQYNCSCSLLLQICNLPRNSTARNAFAKYYRQRSKSVHEMAANSLFKNGKKIGGFIIPENLQLWVISILILLITYIVSIFVHLFLLEESFMCKSNLQCFDINASLSSRPYNCTEQDKVLCYQFVFNISSAISECLSIFASGVAATYLYVWVALKLSRGNKVRYQDCVKTVVYQFGILLSVGIFGAIIMFNPSLQEQKSIIEFTNKLSHFINLIAILITLATLPWWKFEKRDEGETEETPLV